MWVLSESIQKHQIFILHTLKDSIVGREYCTSLKKCLRTNNKMNRAFMPLLPITNFHRHSACFARNVLYNSFYTKPIVIIRTSLLCGEWETNFHWKQICGGYRKDAARRSCFVVTRFWVLGWMGIAFVCTGLHQDHPTLPVAPSVRCSSDAMVEGKWRELDWFHRSRRQKRLINW